MRKLVPHSLSAGKKNRNNFKKVRLPAGIFKYVPQDIKIKIPLHRDIEPERLQLLTYIPWDDSFINNVPEKYRGFFCHVLPHLNARTTDVHTAVSISFVPELIATSSKRVDERLIYLALIVHDCGWKKLSRHELADSLDYKTIAFSPNAEEAKLKHTIYGSAHAYELLGEYDNGKPLTINDKRLISDFVRYHEKPYDFGPDSRVPHELIIACEADRLWPFSKENFWLDTIRKGVDPEEYINIVNDSVEIMLLTDQGKAIAKRMIAERKSEVHLLANQLDNQVNQSNKKIKLKKESVYYLYEDLYAWGRLLLVSGRSLSNGTRRSFFYDRLRRWPDKISEIRSGSNRPNRSRGSSSNHDR